MYCKHCGAALSAGTRFCAGCGAQVAASVAAPIPFSPRPAAGRVGYSPRIDDPAFARYVKNTNRWSGIFSVILAVAAVVGFAIAGETGAEGMSNPEALFIGIGIGGMFLTVALFTVIARKKSKTWDGTVVDKTVKKKSRTQSSGSGDSDSYVRYYTEYAVFIREDSSGRTHRLTAEDDDTRYNYFQVGDRVRHHAGLRSYEKYDKSRDSIVFCGACGTLCDIGDDLCRRCKCPLLN